MVKKICVSIVIGIVLIITLPKFVHSDDYPLLNYGYTAFPVKQHDIQMISEVVKITPSQANWKNYPFMKTEATFVFKNTSNKKLRLKMGFPFGENTHCVPFTTTINGQKVKVSKIHTRNLETKINIKYSYTWFVTFNPYEQKTVQNIYFCHAIEYPHRIIDFYVNYITKTGSFWKGPIKRADFYVAIPPKNVTPIVYQALSQRPTESTQKCQNYKEDEVEWEVCRTIKPAGYKIVKGYIEWHFKNWEPTEDILVAIWRK